MANVNEPSRIVSSVCSAFAGQAPLAQSREARYGPKQPCFLDSSGPGRHKHARGAELQVSRPLLRPVSAVRTQHPTERSRSGTIRAPELNTRTRTMFAVILPAASSTVLPPRM